MSWRVSAEEIRWNGMVSSQFGEPQNWVGGRVPGTGDVALISGREPFVSNVLVEDGDEIHLERIELDLTGSPGSKNIQFEMRGGELDAVTFQVINSGWPVVVGGTVDVDEVIFGPVSESRYPASGMSIGDANLVIGQGGIRVVAEDPEWSTTLILDAATIDLTQSADMPFHVAHGTLEILMSPGSSLRLSGQSPPIESEDSRISLSSYLRSQCGGRVETEMVQAHYDPAHDVTEIRVLDREDGYSLPGDANRDGAFDQLDLVQVQIAAKYATGIPATWGEGDWDGWRKPDQRGDGLFNQYDIVAALQLSSYLHSGCDYARKPLPASAAPADAIPIPEPASALLLVLGTVVVSMRAHQRHL